MAALVHRFRFRSADTVSEIVSEIGTVGLTLIMGSSGGAVVDVLADDSLTDDLVEFFDARGWSFVETTPSTYREREAQAGLGLGASQIGQVPYSSTLAGLVLGVPVVSREGFGIVTSEGFGVVAS
jgi:hypothetical protein